MERSLHFSLNVLRGILHLGSTDWRKWIITSYPNTIVAVYVDTNDIRAFLNGQTIDDEGTITSIVKKYYKPTREQWDILEAGRRCEDDVINNLHDLKQLVESIGSDRFLYVKDIKPQLFYNSVFVREKCDEYSLLRNKGIAVCSLNSNTGLQELIASWFDSSDPEGKEDFCWSSFLRNPLPPSNSAVIVDRYLFGRGRNSYSINNISDLLKAIIPNSFEGHYFVTCLFEADQVGDDIEKSLNYVNKGIRENLFSLLGGKLKLHVNFIAVKKAPERKKGEEEDPKIEAWQNLDYLIHDRCVFTNYYWISATGAIKVSGSNGRAYRWQIIDYKAILTGIDNAFQKKQSLPLFIEGKFFYKLFSFIKAAPSYSYKCYSYNYDEKRITECVNKELSIKNNLVSFKSMFD